MRGTNARGAQVLALLALVALAVGCMMDGELAGDGATPGGKADEGSQGGGPAYTCQVIGTFVNLDGEEAEVDAEGFEVILGGAQVCITGQGPVDCNSLGWGDPMPWSISLEVERDGGETPMILTLLAPNQNAAVGRAYAEAGSAYVGFVLDSTLEALCRLSPTE